MSFQSLSFLAFLAVTLGVCLPLGRRNLRWGQAALTLFCLAFYVLGGGWAALLVLLAGAAVTVAAVRYLTSGGKTEKQRRAAAAVAMATRRRLASAPLCLPWARPRLAFSMRPR